MFSLFSPQLAPKLRSHETKLVFLLMLSSDEIFSQPSWHEISFVRLVSVAFVSAVEEVRCCINQVKHGMA